MRNWLLLCTFIFAMLACEKVNLKTVENLNNNRIWLVGHGGSGFPSFENFLPINSYTSVRKAIEGHNADGLEIDVQMSADSVLFLYHDIVLETLSDCQGCLPELNSNDLRKCRYETNINSNVFMDEKLITLDTVFQFLQNRRIKPIVILDMRPDGVCTGKFGTPGDYSTVMAEKIIALIDKYDAEDWAIVDSGNLDFLIRVENINPQIKTMLIGLIDDQLIQTALDHHFYGVSFNNDETTAEVIKKAHEANLFVSLYTVKDRAGAVRAINKNPDFIEADNLPLMHQMLNAD